MSRIHNFSAGPAVLPESVVEEARENLANLNGSGLGAMECSHRSALFEPIVMGARERVHRLLGCDDDQVVLFLQGGANSQFFMVPMNFLRGGTAAYHDTGVWSARAIVEAGRFGDVDVTFSSKETGYDRVPGPEVGSSGGASYLHYTTNNTVAGCQYHHIPDPGTGFLVADMSSDFLSRPLDASRFGLIYGGAQKNMGPSGVTIVVIRRSLLERCDPELPTMLRYGVHVAKDSMYNTPNTWGIYLIDLVAKWVEEQGLEAIAERNARQSGALYDLIDGSGFYRGLVQRGSRSQMNVTFTTGDAELDTRFWKEAAEEGLSGLKGHRLVGGLRASLYNAQTDAAVSALVDYMRAFESKNG